MAQRQLRKERPLTDLVLAKLKGKKGSTSWDSIIQEVRESRQDMAEKAGKTKNNAPAAAAAQRADRDTAGRGKETSEAAEAGAANATSAANSAPAPRAVAAADDGAEPQVEMEISAKSKSLFELDFRSILDRPKRTGSPTSENKNGKRSCDIFEMARTHNGYRLRPSDATDFRRIMADAELLDTAADGDLLIGTVAYELDRSDDKYVSIKEKSYGTDALTATYEKNSCFNPELRVKALVYDQKSQSVIFYSEKDCDNSLGIYAIVGYASNESYYRNNGCGLMPTVVVNHGIAPCQKTAMPELAGVGRLLQTNREEVLKIAASFERKEWESSPLPEKRKMLAAAFDVCGTAFTIARQMPAAVSVDSESLLILNPNGILADYIRKDYTYSPWIMFTRLYTPAAGLRALHRFLPTSTCEDKVKLHQSLHDSFIDSNALKSTTTFAQFFILLKVMQRKILLRLSINSMLRVY